MVTTTKKCQRYQKPTTQHRPQRNTFTADITNILRQQYTKQQTNTIYQHRQTPKNNTKLSKVTQHKINTNAAHHKSKLKNYTKRRMLRQKPVQKIPKLQKTQKLSTTATKTTTLTLPTTVRRFSRATQTTHLQFILSTYHQVTTTRKYILNRNNNNRFQAYYTILKTASTPQLDRNKNSSTTFGTDSIYTYFYRKNNHQDIDILLQPSHNHRTSITTFVETTADNSFRNKLSSSIHNCESGLGDY